MTGFQKGDRVRLSEAGRAEGLRPRSSRTGTVWREPWAQRRLFGKASSQPGRVAVMWDGTRTGRYVEAQAIEPETPPASCRASPAADGKRADAPA